MFRSILVILLVLVAVVPLAHAQNDANAELVGTTWQWVGTVDGSVTVPNPDAYTLTLKADETFNAEADCNVAGGGYVLDGDMLTLEVGPVTLALCPPESLSEAYIGNLQAVVSYELVDHNLQLTLADGAELLFVAVEPLELVGTTWQWIGRMDASVLVSDPTVYTLTLNDDGSYSVVADCNNAGGSYTLDGDALTLEAGPATMALCPPESLSEDYLAALLAVQRYEITEGELRLTLSDDAGVLRFVPVEDDDTMTETNAAIIGVMWQWQETQGMDDSTESPSDPSVYTLTLNADGTFNVVADCNNASGSYVLDGSQLTLEVELSTMALCPPESLSEDFLTDLGFVRSYVLEDGELYLSLMADGGILRFTAAE